MKHFLLFFASLWLCGCSLDKEIVVKLPDFKSGLVAECYVENGNDVRLYLSESDSYFDTLRFIIVNNAQVVLSQMGRSDTLSNLPLIDFKARKFYNYKNSFPLDFDTTQELKLEIKDSLGRTLSGSTRFLQKPDVDTIEVRYSTEKDSLAGFLVWINDFPDVSNYYRIIMNEDSLTGPPAVSFTFADNGGLNGKRFPIGTTNRFKPGKTMFFRIYHIEQAYYDYLRSMEAAGRANGNPFAQPSTIRSPLKGDGYGIITALSYRTFSIKY